MNRHQSDLKQFPRLYVQLQTAHNEHIFVSNCVELLDWFSYFMTQTTCFHASSKHSFSWLRRWVTSFAGNMPTKSHFQKWVWMCRFKPKHQNFIISQILNPIKSKFEDQAKSRPPLPEGKSNVADGRHLENRYHIITPPQRFRFGWTLVARCRTACPQRWNDQSKPEVEFLAICIRKLEVIIS